MPFDNAGFWFAPTAANPAELGVQHPAGYRYRDPMPTYARRTPAQVLTAYYGNGGHDEADQTNRNGASRMQVEVALRLPDIILEPVRTPTFVHRWPRPANLDVVPVPVGIRGGGRVEGFSKVVIDFRNRDQGPLSRGISVDALYSDRPPAMVDAGEKIMYRFMDQWKDMVLTLAWPGYTPERFPLRPTACIGGPLTRWDLGQQIAMAYAVFFKKVEAERRLPAALNFFNIAFHQGKNSRPGELGVQLTQLYLVRFRNTVGGFWVADVEIV